MDDFERKFWRDQATRPGGLVIEGKHYRDSGTTDSPHRGFAGHTFAIRELASGRVWITNNLWHQGTIPEDFKGLFPDTHEFVKPGDYTATEVETQHLEGGL